MFSTHNARIVSWWLSLPRFIIEATPMPTESTLQTHSCSRGGTLVQFLNLHTSDLFWDPTVDKICPSEQRRKLSYFCVLGFKFSPKSKRRGRCLDSSIKSWWFLTLNMIVWRLTWRGRGGAGRWVKNPFPSYTDLAPMASNCSQPIFSPRLRYPQC